MFTKSKSIGCLDLWNSFLLTLILSNCKCLFTHSYTEQKKVHIYFVMLLFCTELVADSFLFNLVFFFFWQVFVSILWLFFYCFFVLWIILSSFFFRISFFCILQGFFSVKPVLTDFYILLCQVNKKIFFS